MAQDVTVLPRRSRSTHHVGPFNDEPDENLRQPGDKAMVAGGVDKGLLYTTMILAFLGVVAVYSASAPEAMDTMGNSLYYVQRQIVFFVMGFGLMLAVSRLPFFAWARFARPLALLVIGLLVYTLANGVESYGAERWIQIAGFQFQPSELGKLSVVLLLAHASSKKTDLRGLLERGFNLFLIVLTLVLIFKQPSLSMTIILLSVFAGTMFIEGVPLWFLTIAGGVAVTGAAYKIMSTEYQMRRIMGWLDPWKDPQDTGYNAIQSFYAIGSGGLLGTGLGMSTQKLHWLPFRHTDFIFSVWAEEWGFLGCVVLLGCFGFLLYRGYHIAQSCRSSFGQLLAMGITLILTIQIIINICVATGLFPVTGVTLPLISYGGTSVIVTMVMLGILLNISRYRTAVSQLPQR